MAGMNPSYFIGWSFFRFVYATYFRWRVYHPERVPLTGAGHSRFKPSQFS